MRLMHFDGIAANAACLQGHFPGNPIVPGAILLGFLARGLDDLGYEISTIQRLKFMRPLLPENPFEIRWDMGAQYSKILWVSCDETIAQARIELQPKDG